MREVERGTWHGLLTTPAGAAAIVLGKLANYFVLGLLLFAALTALAAALFDTPLNGWALWLAAALFMTAKPGAWSGDLAAGTHADAGHADGRSPHRNHINNRVSRCLPVTRHRQQRPEPTESGSTQAMRSTCASRVLSKPTATRRPVRLNGDPTGATDDDDSHQQ